MKTGEDPGELVIDHIDGNRLNNKFRNLRATTQQENMFNRLGTKGERDLPQGVSKTKAGNKYTAKIVHNYGTIYLGTFKTAEAAHLAYLHKKQELHGDVNIKRLIKDLDKAVTKSLK